MALSDGLVGYWSPWLGSSGYRLLDRTGRGNHGTLTNMDAGTDWVGACVQGRSGYALDFDGSNDYVLASDKNFPTGNATVSMSHWILLKNTTTAGGVFGYGSTSGSLTAFKTYANLRGAGVISVEFAGGNPAIGPTITTNNWHHVAVVKTPGAINATTSIYLNGILQTLGGASSANTPNIALQSLTIGLFINVDFSPIQFVDGGIWSRAITTSEVLELYRLGPGWYRPYRKRSIGYAATGFKAYWHRRQQQIIGGGLR